MLYVTGCGSAALKEFTLYPGSSSFALEAGNLYSKGSLIEHLKVDPEKYVCQEVSEKISLNAFLQGHKIIFYEEEWYK